MNFAEEKTLEAVVRLEKKVDELLKMVVEERREKAPARLPLTPLSSPNQGGCPVCLKQIIYDKYQVPVDGALQEILIRRCGCVPRSNELPINQGDRDAY